MEAPALTVAILAGGAASRLGGRDKGLETIRGRPLIEWVLDYCAEHVVRAVASKDSPRDVELLIIANRHLDDYARYAPVCSDLAPGFRGPLAGVASALGAAATVAFASPWSAASPERRQFSGLTSRSRVLIVRAAPGIGPEPDMTDVSTVTLWPARAKYLVRPAARRAADIVVGGVT